MSNAVQCPSRIVGLDANAEPVCSPDEFSEAVVHSRTSPQSCRVECKDGYEPVGDPAAFFTCGHDADWININDPERSIISSLVCVPKVCPALPDKYFIDPYDPAVASTCEQAGKLLDPFANTCSISCASGFTSSGDVSEIIVCTGTETTSVWIPTKFSCLPNGCGESIQNLDPHATAICSNDVNWNMKIPCIASCNEKEGWVPAETLGNDGLHFCDRSGSWLTPSSVAFACEPIKCSNQAFPFDGPINAKLTEGCESSFNSTNCEAICIEGYEGDSVQYQCSANGQWLPVGGDIECTKVDCGSDIIFPVQVVNARNRCVSGGTLFKSICANTCKDGYKPLNPAASLGYDEFECTSTGEWQAATDTQRLECVPRECLTPVVPPSMSGCDEKRYTDEQCVLTCAPGYNSIGKDSSQTYTCIAQGDNDPILSITGDLTCEPKDCGDLSPSNDQRTIECTSTLYNDICTTECANGYEPKTELVDERVYTCGTDGLWKAKSDSPLCVRVDCGNGTDIDIGGFAFLDCQETKFEDKCVAVCKEGYTESSERSPRRGRRDVGTHTCNSDGVWELGLDIPLQCEPIKCDRQSLSLGSEGPQRAVEESYDDDFNGDGASVVCPPGYEDKTGTIAHYICTALGKWIIADGSTALECVPITCPADFVKPPFNVTILDDKYSGAGLIVECPQGYGPDMATYHCSTTGDWALNSEEVNCPPIECPSVVFDGVGPETPITLSLDPKFNGEGATVVCSEGFVNDGSDSAKYICTTDGTWKLHQFWNALSCNPVDCGLPSVVEGRVATCESTVFLGGGCQFTCDTEKGYSPTEGSLKVSSIECLASGAWQNELGFTCEQTECTSSIPSINPDLAVATCETLTFGATCTAMCKPGMVAQSRNYTCTGSVSPGTWEPVTEELVCERVSCGPTLDSAWLHTSNILYENTDCSEHMLFEDECTGICDPAQGYIPDQFSYDCTSEGAWSGPAASCNLKLCDPLPVVKNGKVTQLTGDRVGSTARATCDEGYEGPPSTIQITCDVNGMWEGTLPECTPVSCGALVDGSQVTSESGAPDFPSHASVIEGGCTGITFMNTCSATCDPLYYDSLEISSVASGRFICTSTGEWKRDSTSKRLDCIPRRCPPQIRPCLDGDSTNCLPNNAQQVLAECNINAVAVDGTDCHAQCKDGYELDKYEPFACTGNFDSSEVSVDWAGYIQCSRKDCGPTIPADLLPAFSVSNCESGTEFEDSCTIHCEPGYEEATSSFTCEADGTWKQSVPLDCTPKSCAEFVPYSGKNYVSPMNCSGVNRQFNGGGRCQQLCKPGYEDLRPNSGLYTCAEFSGTVIWVLETESTLTLDCNRKNCGVNPGAGLINVKPASCTNTLFESECTRECLPGYESAPETVGEYKCSEDGTWKLGSAGPPLDCLPKICEFSEAGLELLGFAGIAPDCSVEERTFGGPGCSVNCPVGFDMYQEFSIGEFTVLVEGPATFVCEPIGDLDLSGNRFTCKPKKCDRTQANLLPKHVATLNCSAKASEYSEVLEELCQSTCIPGYEDSRPGAKGLYFCDENGDWVSNNPLSCSPKSCSSSILPEVEGRSPLTCLSVFGEPGCKAECDYDRGYYLAGGDGVYICNEQSEWTGNMTCDRATCDSAPPTEFSTPCDASSIAIGDKCEANCVEGYRETNPGVTRTYTCEVVRSSESDIPTATWKATTTPMACEPIHCSTFVSDGNLSHGSFYGDCTGNTAYGGTGCTTQCAYGFVGDAPTLQCGSGGDWIMPSPSPNQCRRATSCSSATFEVIYKNARLEKCTTEPFGTVCEASCKDGYVGEGDPTFTCGNDGIFTGVSGGCTFNCLKAPRDSSIVLRSEATSATYVFSGKNVTRSNAQIFCNDVGEEFSLASLSGAGEFSSIKTGIQSFLTRGLTLTEKYWIGGDVEWIREPFNNETVTVTWQDSEAFDYNAAPWAPGEPNNLFGSEYCLEVSTIINNIGLLNDGNCNLGHGALCKRRDAACVSDFTMINFGVFGSTPGAELFEHMIGDANEATCESLCRVRDDCIGFTISRLGICVGYWKVDIERTVPPPSGRTYVKTALLNLKKDEAQGLLAELDSGYGKITITSQNDEVDEWLEVSNNDMENWAERMSRTVSIYTERDCENRGEIIATLGSADGQGAAIIDETRSNRVLSDGLALYEGHAAVVTNLNGGELGCGILRYCFGSAGSCTTEISVTPPPTIVVTRPPIDPDPNKPKGFELVYQQPATKEESPLYAAEVGGFVPNEGEFSLGVFGYPLKSAIQNCANACTDDVCGAFLVKVNAFNAECVGWGKKPGNAISFDRGRTSYSYARIITATSTTPTATSPSVESGDDSLLWSVTSARLAQSADRRAFVQDPRTLTRNPVVIRDKFIRDDASNMIGASSQCKAQCMENSECSAVTVRKGAGAHICSLLSKSSFDSSLPTIADSSAQSFVKKV